MMRRDNRFETTARLRLAACLTLLLPSLVFAQAELGTYRGTVVDAEGDPIEGATVRLVDAVRGGEIVLETNDKGSFYRRNVRPSDYTVTVEKEGFTPYEEATSFKAGEEKRQEIRLAPAISAAEAAFARGIEAFNAGNFEEAATAFEEVTRASPETPEGHTNLALAYMQLRRMPDAVQELEKAAELSTDSFRTWAQLAMAYIQVDRLPAAVSAFEKALEQEHDPNDPMAVESWMTLGALYFSQNRVQDAVGAYEKALAGAPESPDVLIALGKCHFNLNEMDTAKGYFEKVLTVNADAAQTEEAKTFITEIEARTDQPPE